jgi:hypothetical protein
MTDVKMFQLRWTLRQTPQIIQLLMIHLEDGPTRRGLRDLVEPFETLDSSYNLVVISTDYSRAMFARPIQDQPRLRIVSHQIAAANDLIEFPFRIGNYCLQSVPIRVSICQNQELHKPYCSDCSFLIRYEPPLNGLVQ